MNYSIYCCCNGENVPREKFVILKATPVIRAGMNESLFPGFVRDDVGDNIYNLLGHGVELNSYFSELTAIYWMWKNSLSSHVGICHYRRFWDEGEIISSPKDALYVAKPLWFSHTILGQYYECHPSFIIDMPKILYDCIDDTPITSKMLDKMWGGNYLYWANFIRGPKVTVDKVLDLYFNIIFKVWNRSKDSIFKIEDSYQKRAISFLSERIMTTILMNADILLGINKIEESTLNFIN